MCDRMFNSMKSSYHRRNVYTLEDTFKILNLDENVTVYCTIVIKISMIGTVFLIQFTNDQRQDQ